MPPNILCIDTPPTTCETFTEESSSLGAGVKKTRKHTYVTADIETRVAKILDRMFPILRHPSQSSRLPYSEGQKGDPGTNKGATVTKDGEGTKRVWKEEEEEESEKEETARQEAAGTKKQ